MGVRYLKKHAALEGYVSAEEAEALSQWLKDHKKPAVQLARCERVHAAVLQVLMARAPTVLTPPQDPWLAHVLGCALAQPAMAR